MFPSLKAVFTLLSLMELVSSRHITTTSPKRQKLKEISQQLIPLLHGEAQVPCNDTRVAQVPFTDGKLSEKELLCQAAKVLDQVTKCRKEYEPFIINLQSLHDKTPCTLSDETEIYLRNFLPELKNFIQGMYRALAPSPKP